MASAHYILQVRRLLHDANGNYWTDAELLDNINQARKAIALQSGSVRTLYNFYLSASQEAYPFSGAVASLTLVDGGSAFTATPTISISGGGGSGASASATLSSSTVSAVTITANGTGYTAAPTVTCTDGSSSATVTASIMNALDILGITVNWGNQWIALQYTYFSQFQANARFYRSTTGQPRIWSKGPPAQTAGGDYFYLFYIPDQGYQCDIDAIGSPNDLVDDDTAEQLAYPYTDLVQYWAAYISKFKQQEFNEAANFMRIYEDLFRQYTGNRYQRRIPSPYGY